MQTRITTLIITCLTVFMFAQIASAGSLEGIIHETGWGKFKIKDKDDIVRLVNISKKLTRFTPRTWRPVVGDKVSVSYTTEQKRKRPILRADVITLVKKGPNTVTFESPVQVTIVETGKTGVKAEIADTGKVVKFTKNKRTQYLPVGWVPAAGEKASIEFIAQPARFVFGLNYLITKIERVKKPVKEKRQ